MMIDQNTTRITCNDDINRDKKQNENDDSQMEKIKAIYATQYIDVNIGGFKYSLSLTLLEKYPNSMIYKDYKQNAVLFYDRNSSLFKYILEILKAHSLLYNHKRLDPRKLNQIIKELHYYNFIQDLPQVIEDYLYKPMSIEDTTWFISQELQSSFKLLSIHPSLFQYEANQCNSFVILNKVFRKEKIKFNFSIDSNKYHKCIYVGLINENYSKEVNGCLCKMPINTYCFFSNGTIAINGKQYSTYELIYCRTGTQYNIDINLTDENNKTIEFSRSNTYENNPMSQRIFGNEFYLVWGACSGEGGCIVSSIDKK